MLDEGIYDGFGMSPHTGEAPDGPGTREERDGGGFGSGGQCGEEDHPLEGKRASGLQEACGLRDPNHSSSIFCSPALLFCLLSCSRKASQCHPESSCPLRLYCSFLTSIDIIQFK